MSEMLAGTPIRNVIEDHLAALARGYEPRQVSGRTAGLKVMGLTSDGESVPVAIDGMDVQLTVEQPIPDLEAKRERAKAFGDYLTNQGDRILDQENEQHFNEYGAIQAGLLAAVEAIAPLVATGSDGDLGDVGAYEAELYRIEVNRLVQQHRQLVARQRTLAEGTAQHAKRRELGGQAVYLELLDTQPAAAAKAAQMLHGHEEFVVEPFKAEYAEVDPDNLEPLRHKLQRKINKAEELHKILLERDARRGNLITMTDEELRKYPALRGHPQRG
jgi:hypothetical protein